MSDDRPGGAGESPGAEAPESAAGAAPRRLLWALAILAIAAVIGLVTQTLRARAMQAENEVLVGELFAARSALDAYVTRFAEVRQSIESLQAELSQLGSLVSEDPLTPLPAETGERTGGPGASVD